VLPVLLRSSRVKRRPVVTVNGSDRCQLACANTPALLFSMFWKLQPVQRILHQVAACGVGVQPAVLAGVGVPGAGIVAPFAAVVGLVMHVHQEDAGLVVDEAARLGAEAQFLAGLAVVIPEAARVAVHVERRALVVGCVEVVVLVGGDRGQVVSAQVPVQFRRGAIAAGDQRPLIVVVDGIDAAAIQEIARIAVAALLREPAPRQACGGVGGERVDAAVGKARRRRRVDGAAVGGLAAARLGVQRDAGVEVRAGRQQELHAAGHAVLVGVGDVRVVGVLDVAGALADADRGAVRQQVVDDRAAGRIAGQHRVQLAQRQRPRSIRRERRPAGGDVDHPDTGVLAQQRSLRAARDFDRIDIGEVVAGGQRVISIVDAIDDQADAGILRLGLALLADAAYRQAGGALVALVPGHVGGALRQRLDVGGLQAIELLAGDDGDRQRHVLQALQPVAAAHRHFAQGLVFLRRCSLGAGFGCGNGCSGWRCCGAGALVGDDVFQARDFRLQLRDRGIGGISGDGAQHGGTGNDGSDGQEFEWQGSVLMSH
jgi:hypothetical protein